MISASLRCCKFAFAKLDNYYFMEPNRDAVLFAHKQLTWNHKMIIDNARAFSNGLHQLSYIEGDNILVRLNPDNFEQKLVIKIAATHKKAKICISKATTQQQFTKQLLQTKARSLIFGSYNRLGNTTVIDTIYRIIPQLLRAQNDHEIIPRSFRYLRSLIQIDNYKNPGTFAFKNIMKFGLESDYGSLFDCDQKTIKLDKLPDNKRPIVITEPCEDLAFRAGVLNCLENGNLLVCALPSQLKQISQMYNHLIDVICTQPMTELHQQNRVFVSAGSKLYQKHPQRHQIIL